MRAEHGVGLVRPRLGLGRPPGVGVVLGVALDLGARRQPRLADEHDQAVGSETSASTASRSGATDHSSSSSRVERLDGVLADLDRAAGAERPASRPRSRPTARGGRPASARRRRARRTAPTASRPRRRPAAAPSASAAASSRSASLVGLERGTAARRGRRGRASRGPRARRSRGRPSALCSAAGSNESSRQLHGHLAPLPGATREDAGREGQRSEEGNGAPQALGLGQRGRSGGRGRGRRSPRTWASARPSWRSRRRSRSTTTGAARARRLVPRRRARAARRLPAPARRRRAPGRRGGVAARARAGGRREPRR